MDYIVKAYKDWKLHSQFQEIVPDMDDEYMFNEKQSIRDSARTLKKYGSTCCNQIRNNETLIRHEIEKTDTLQGIALKYGCTTEQIRRANRLFASDSLFLRQYLLVPVEKSSPYYPAIIEDPNSMPSPIDYQHHAGTILQNSSSNNATTTTHTGAAPIATATTIHNHRTLPTVNSENCLNDNSRFNNDLPARPYSIAGEMSLQTNHENNLENLNNHYTGGGSCSSGVGTSSAASSSKQSKSLDSVVTPMSPEEENRKCINEFLNKIDNTISESRKYVEKSKEMIASQSDDGIFTSTDFVQRTRRNNLNNSYKNNTRQNHQNHVRQSSTGSGSDTSYLLNTTQTRHLQSRLTHLEKQQDEFFEL